MKEQYENEVNQLLATLDQLGIPKTTEGLTDHLFGDKSRLMQSLVKALGKEAHEIHQFLATIYFAAELGLPAHRLQKHPNIKYDKYMDKDALNSFWNDVADAGKNGISPTYLWETVEDCLNADCRDLFLNLKDQTYKLRIALDDDKVHFQFRTLSVVRDSTYMCGLSGVHHVVAKCRGFIIDSAVAAATDFPLCFRARREGRSTAQNYEDMFRFMFHLRFTVAGMAALALNNIVFCSDRGYWQSGIILLILQLGGSVFGTLMRKEWVPFTYEQKYPGKRRVVEKKYGRRIYLAYARWCNIMLKIMAFCTGTGDVSLAMDSEGIEGQPQVWELGLKNDGDYRWYISQTLTPKQRKLKAFQSLPSVQLEESDERNIEYHIDMLSVVMLTCQDMDYSWAALRKFAFTSSASAKTINDAAMYVPPEHPIRTSYQAIIDFADLGNSLSDPEDDDVTSSNGDGDPVAEALPPVDAELVKQLVKSMRAGSTETLEDCKAAAKRLLEKLEAMKNSPQSQLLSSMLTALGVRLNRAMNEISDINKMKLLRQWAKSISSSRSASEYKFPYDKLLDAKDVELMVEKRVGDVLASGNIPDKYKNPKNKEMRIELLQYIDKNPAYSQSAQQRDPEYSPLVHVVLTAIIRRGFLQALTGNEKKEARLGHQNEEPYLTEYFNDSQLGRVPDINICDIRRVGLAMHNDKPYVRDSADAIAFERRNGDQDGGDYFDEMTSHTIECKCRAQSGYDGSLRQAKNIRRKLLDTLDISARITAEANGHAVYKHISSSQQDLLKKFIPNSNERIQILHHAYTYSRKRTTLLVGGPDGKLLYGIIVTFEDDVLNAYGQVLDFLYNSGLHLFYAAEKAGDLPLDTIKNVIDNDDTLKGNYTLGDLVTSALICNELLPGNRSGVQHPLPACNTLIPYEYALWNVSKGGSDTVTRLIWNCLSILPIKTPQTVMIARYLMIYGVLHHRLVQQAGSGRKSISVTDTLQQLRERANKYLAFHDSLGILSKFHLNASQSSQASNSVQEDVNSQTYAMKPAPRFDKNAKRKQFSVNHSILGDSLGGTPIGKSKGKGRSKQFLDSKPNSFAIKQREDSCKGFLGRIFLDNGKKGGDFDLDRRQSCDLCKARNVTTMCAGCKRVLCFDRDRRERILNLLEGEDGDELRERFPVLANLRRRDVPSFYTEIGRVGDKRFVMGLSCWHLSHPSHFCSPCNDMDGQLSHVAASGEGIDSPQAL
ncbi:hypothetical protein ACHAWC_011885 [Mediolabrus comicus]